MFRCKKVINFDWYQRIEGCRLFDFDDERRTSNVVVSFASTRLDGKNPLTFLSMGVEVFLHL